MSLTKAELIWCLSFKWRVKNVVKNQNHLKYLDIWYHVETDAEKAMAPTPVGLPGKSHGWRSLVGCSPWGRSGLETTEWLPFHFSLSCIGEGNGNPLQCSCLENPRDRGAWWAAVYGVSQSRTQLKRLSSSSSSSSSRNWWCFFHFCPDIT